MLPFFFSCSFRSASVVVLCNNKTRLFSCNWDVCRYIFLETCSLRTGSSRFLARPRDTCHSKAATDPQKKNVGELKFLNPYFCWWKWSLMLIRPRLFLISQNSETNATRCLIRRDYHVTFLVCVPQFFFRNTVLWKIMLSRIAPLMTRLWWLALYLAAPCPCSVADRLLQRLSAWPAVVRHSGAPGP